MTSKRAREGEAGETKGVKKAMTTKSSINTRGGGRGRTTTTATTNTTTTTSGTESPSRLIKAKVLKPFLKTTNKQNAAMVKGPEHNHVVIPLEDLPAANPAVQLFDGEQNIVFRSFNQFSSSRWACRTFNYYRS